LSKAEHINSAEVGVVRLDGDTVVLTLVSGGGYHAFKMTLGAAASLGGRITEALARAAAKPAKDR
jgi:hypothetical protein